MTTQFLPIPKCPVIRTVHGKLKHTEYSQEGIDWCTLNDRACALNSESECPEYEQFLGEMEYQAYEQFLKEEAENQKYEESLEEQDI